MDDEYATLRSNLEEEYYEEAKKNNGNPSKGKTETQEKSKVIRFSKEMLSEIDKGK